MTAHIVSLLSGLQPGGLERVAVDLACGLGPDARTSVLCFDSLGPLQEALPARTIVELLQRRPGRDWRFAWRLRRWLAARSPQVLHVHNPTALFYGALAVWGTPIRLVYTDHGRTEPLGPRTCAALRRVARRVQSAIAVAPHLRDELRERLGFREEQIGCIPNGIDLERFAAPPRRRIDGGDEVVLGTVGRLADGKDHDVLLHALAALREEIPRFRLEIVGSGSQRHPLEARAADLGLGDRVRFLGSRLDIPDLLASWDAFVHPSRGEAFPMAVLEAAASALPMVCSDIPGHHAVLGTPPRALLFPPADPLALTDRLRALAGSPALAAELGAAAAAHVRERFSRGTMVRRYRAAYGLT